MDLDLPATSTARETSPEFGDGLSFENGFRGFKKLPIVLLERVDIIPLLNHRFKHIQNRNQTMDDAEKLHSYKLSLQVSVVLVRTDLNKLKKEFNETGNTNNNICSKSNKILSRLKSSTKNIKDERQPQKRQDTTKDAWDSTQQLKILTKNKRNTRKDTEASSKERVTKSNSSQLAIDLTNEDQSNNATLALASKTTSSKYLNVLTDKTASENSTNNLSVNNSSKKLNQKSVNPNDFNTKTIDFTNPPKKAIVDPKSKKTIISRHHCEVCGKYLSSNFTLMRHKFTVHTGDVESGCDLCGEKFARPSLLKCHRCPCNNGPLYVDAGPGVQFNNTANGSDVVDLDEDGMDDEDFEIPAPIVELTEYDESEPLVSGVNNTCVVPLENVRYNIVVQEVPIEF